MRTAVFAYWGFALLITSSVLILGIFVLRKLTFGKISMRLRYGLWLLVAVRLLMPLPLGTSPVSVMHLFSGISQIGVTEQEAAQALQGTNDVGAGQNGIDQGRGGAGQGGMGQDRADAQGMTSVGEESDAAFDVDGNNGMDTAFLLQNPGQGTLGAGSDVDDMIPAGTSRRIARVFVIMAVWAAGFLAVGGYMLFMRLRFLRHLRKNRRRVPEKEVPAVMGERLKKRGIRVYRVKGLPSPCLVGKNIYIGSRTAGTDRGERTDRIAGAEQTLTHILAHEYCHSLHGDGFWAFLRCALTAVYWFDPFVWAAAYAARRDSDLACDEAVVRLLGEKERFAYGRTLLTLLQENGDRPACPGMPPMFMESERSVRERIVSLSEKTKTEAVVLVTVFSLLLLLCGCAFTGAGTGSAAGGDGADQASGQEGGAAKAQEKEQSASGGEAEREHVLEEPNDEFAQIREEYEALEEENDAAFQEVLNYRGVMEGRDDSELSLDRKVDIQLFVDHLTGREEKAPETGWYLLCRSEDEKVSVYGLYTEEFGCRGMKLLIGEDVNTFDLVWYPSYMNAVSENIWVMEETADGMPRRFVWKYMEEESSDTEIWQLAGGYRYDTGTVDITLLSEEDYLSWADWHLTYSIDQEKQEIRVCYDGDENALAGILDISDYADFTVEAVQIVPEIVGFELNSDLFGEENIIIFLAPGLQLKGLDGLWFDDIYPISVQVLWDEDGTGFQMGQPKVDERYVVHGPLGRNRELEAIRENRGNGQEDESGETQDGGQAAGEAGRLARPLVNSEDAHYDLKISFRNPCPEYDQISDAFGERTNPATGEVRAHNGVDMAAAEGADVLAAAEGTVFETGFDAESGNYIVLWHGQSGQMTYYAHCKEILVSEGDQVAAGGKIATVGQTGRATGPHLHFALSYEGEWQDPVYGQRTRETE